MKTIKKISLITIMIGSMIMIAQFTQGQNTRANNNAEKVNSIMPFISAGFDISICNGTKIQTQGINTYQTGMTLWLTSGDGTFENPYGLNTTYTAGKQDIQTGKVTLTLIYLPLALLSGPPVKDDMVVNFDNCNTTTEINEF